MYASPPEFEFQGNIFKFRKRNKISSLHFHVLVVEKRQRNVQKSVMHVQSCCFAYYTYCSFRRSCCCRVVESKVPNLRSGDFIFFWRGAQKKKIT